MEEIHQKRLLAFNDLLEEIKTHKKILYMDEYVFCPYKVTRKAWATKG
jgi:hypothetical protein